MKNRLLLLFFIPILLLTTLYADITTGLIAHYEFEGNTNDSSGNGYSLITGGTQTYEAGVLGQAYNFNGIDNNLSYSGLPISGDGTISYWIKDSNNTSVEMYLSTGGFDGTSRIMANEGNAELTADTAGNTGDNITSSGTLDGMWHHVAVTFFGTTTKIYIDGIDRALDYDTVEDINISSLLNIGHEAGIFLFTGSLDDVRIYNRALTASDILELQLPKLSLKAHGGVVQFNDVDTINSIKANTTNTISSHTIEAWINTKNVSTTYIFYGITALQEDAGSFSQIHMTSAGLLSAEIQHNYPTNSTITTVTGTTSINDGSWHHVAQTYDATTGNYLIYINGSLEGSATAGINYDYLAPAIRVGIGHTGYPSNWVGMLDEVRIWDVVKTSAEINASMNQQLEGNETGLVAYYNFDERIGNNIVDVAGGDLNATIEGNVTRLNFLDNSIDFNGTSLVYRNAIDVSGSEMTVSAWINPTDSTSVQEIVHNSFVNTIFRINTNELQIIYDPTDTASVSMQTLSYAFTASDFLNKWQYVTATIKNTGTNTIARIYINGIVVAENSSWPAGDIPYTVTGQGFAIGGNSSPDGATQNTFFNGKIAQVSIWNKALTQNDINRTMHTSLKGNETGLVGYWPLNEGTGSIAYDRSINSNDGIIAGATWIETAPKILGDKLYTRADLSTFSKLILENNTTTPTYAWNGAVPTSIDFNSTIGTFMHSATDVNESFSIAGNNAGTEYNVTVRTINYPTVAFVYLELNLSNVLLTDHNITNIQVIGEDGNIENFNIPDVLNLTDGNHSYSVPVYYPDNNFSIRFDTNDTLGNISWWHNFQNNKLYLDNNGSDDFKSTITSLNNTFTIDLSSIGWANTIPQFVLDDFTNPMVLGGLGSDKIEDIKIDTNGSVIVVGYHVGEFDIGQGVEDYNLTNTYSDDSSFVIKYSASGKVLWAHSFGGIGADDNAYAVTLDSNGSILVTGTFEGTADFNGTSLIATGAQDDIDIFIWKLSTNGETIWVKQLEGGNGWYGSDERGYDIVTDSSDNIYVTGTFDGTTDFDPGASVYNLTPFKDSGDSDVFVMKLDVNGNFVWATHSGSDDNDEGSAIAIDSANNVYIGGYFVGDNDGLDLDGDGLIDINTTAVQSDGSYTEYDQYVGFVSKYLNDGTYSWTKLFLGKNGSFDGDFSRVNDIQVDSANNVYAAGVFEREIDFNPDLTVVNAEVMGENDNGFLVKLDTNGVYQWHKRFGEPNISTKDNTANIDKMVINSLGEIYLIDDFNGDFDADPSVSEYLLRTLGDYDSFILKLNSDGSFAWAKQFGGDGFSSGDAIALDSNENIWVVSDFKDDVDVNPTLIEDVRNSLIGSRDSFIVKMSSSGDIFYEYYTYENISSTIKVKAQDLENSTLTYSISGTDSSVFAINNSTGDLTFVSPADFENPLDVGIDNIYEINISVNDGTDTVTQNVSIIVEDVNVVLNINLTNTTLTDHNITNIQVVGVDGNSENFNIPDVVNIIDGANSYMVPVYNPDNNFSIRFDTNDTLGNLSWWYNFTENKLYTDNNGSVDFKTEINASNYSFAIDLISTNWTAIPTLPSLALIPHQYSVKNSGDFNVSLLFSSTSGDSINVAVDYNTSFANVALSNTPVLQANYASEYLTITPLTDITGETNVTISWEDNTTVQSQEFNITVAPYGTKVIAGWNLLSLPVSIDLNRTDLIDTFAHNTNIERLYKYNSRWSYWDSQTGYDTTVPMSKFSSIHSTEGFWLKATADTNIVYNFEENLTSHVKDWTRQIGTVNSDAFHAAVVGTDNYVYITGTTDDALNGNTQIGPSDAVLVKYSPSGDLIWTKQFGSTSYDYAYAIGKDSANNIYVSGSTQGDIDGNTNSGADDLYLTKFDSDGNKLWTKQYGPGGGSWSAAYGIANDSNDNIYLVGESDGAFDSNTNSGSSDVLLMKFAPDGTKAWSKLFGTTGYEYGHRIRIDTNDALYIIGQTDGNLSGNINAGSYDVFVSKFDTNGNEIWTKQYGTSSADGGASLALSSNNEIYTLAQSSGNLDGYTSLGLSDLYISKFSADGTKLWTKQYGNSVNNSSNFIKTDSNDNIYIAGINTNTNNDIFISKFDYNGNNLWSYEYDSGAHDYSAAMAVSPGGKVYVGGYTFAGLDGKTYYGAADAYVMKLNTVPEYTRNIYRGGWRIMGFPEDKTPQNIVDSIEDDSNATITYKVDYIYKYEYENVLPHWEVYAPDSDLEASIDTTIERTDDNISRYDAIWVYVRKVY